jgi:hypothetical protein
MNMPSFTPEGTAALGSALAYAARGWPVFPCRPGRKDPATEHGFLDATTDADVIREWWRARPDCNVAIATGAPGPDVLDVDTDHDGSGFAAFGRLKRAGLLAGAGTLVRTRSGGLHAYYTGTSQPCGRLPRHHLDFKACGGYVIAPPSQVHGRPYELVDQRDTTAVLDWPAIRKLLDPAPAVRYTRHSGGGDITRLAEWVAMQPEGNRNCALFWAANRALESDLDPDALLAAATAAGLSETEARRTVSSARRANEPIR